ncbi:MAG: hypothetical protein WC856_02680 [Methylococcaceae bacterium]|jgi:hypothetical protein
MANEADQGNDTAELFLKVALKNASSKKLDTGNKSGLCWYCDTPTGTERRFCDRECARSWEREQ